MKFISVTTLAAALASSASAISLVVRSAQDVFVPVITSPTSSSVWTVGSTQKVTWETANAPVHITNSIGQVMLVKGGTPTPLVLATGFSILDGTVSFPVPNVINGTDYEIQLFGDSGDFSPAFTITGSDSLF
ncbi:hypothetical protein HYPSUDRAFT_91697 [Hypholoma sublateritium FD-334 SS-4]|uniref:Yeast cell wall synthesis Kre9/Knh1-like N-terminal domain-containing protein n=1 Tax=Hypholoma sublateritium (strain FD-334 SS-4) TaxID=945553 RepID=A0A0D2LYA7_HYPSF|nr:hypothetical protein HYPSUDRAFT_91697 [Hypholoma sublateritium FD-334 SS-4]